MDNQPSKSKIHKRRRRLKWLGLSVIALVLSMSGVVARAQQPVKVIRLGSLLASSASVEKNRIETFRQALRELGYVEGKNIVIEFRYAELFDRLPDLAAELVRLKVDIIGRFDINPRCETSKYYYSDRHGRCRRSGRGGIRCQPESSGSQHHWPVRASRPEISGKHLEAFEGDQFLSSPVWPSSGNQPSQHSNVKRSRTRNAGIKSKASKGRRIRCQRYRECVPRRRARGVLTPSSYWPALSPLIISRTQIADLAIKSRLPGIYDRREFVDQMVDLCLMGQTSPICTGVPQLTWIRSSKVETPADLPVEQPKQVRVHHQLEGGEADRPATIPPEVLARADQVIR